LPPVFMTAYMGWTPKINLKGATKNRALYA